MRFRGPYVIDSVIGEYTFDSSKKVKIKLLLYGTFHCAYYQGVAAQLLYVRCSTKKYVTLNQIYQALRTKKNNRLYLQAEEQSSKQLSKDPFNMKNMKY
jgi:hypothetical protein